MYEMLKCEELENQSHLHSGDEKKDGCWRGQKIGQDKRFLTG